MYGMGLSFVGRFLGLFFNADLNHTDLKPENFTVPSPATVFFSFRIGKNFQFANRRSLAVWMEAWVNS